MWRTLNEISDEVLTKHVFSEFRANSLTFQNVRSTCKRFCRLLAKRCVFRIPDSDGGASLMLYISWHINSLSSPGIAKNKTTSSPGGPNGEVIPVIWNTPHHDHMKHAIMKIESSPFDRHTEISGWIDYSRQTLPYNNRHDMVRREDNFLNGGTFFTGKWLQGVIHTVEYVIPRFHYSNNKYITKTLQEGFYNDLKNTLSWMVSVGSKRLSILHGYNMHTIDMTRIYFPEFITHLYVSNHLFRIKPSKLPRCLIDTDIIVNIDSESELKHIPKSLETLHATIDPSLYKQNSVFANPIWVHQLKALTLYDVMFHHPDVSLMRSLSGKPCHIPTTKYCESMSSHSWNCELCKLPFTLKEITIKQSTGDASRFLASVPPSVNSVSVLCESLHFHHQLDILSPPSDKNIILYTQGIKRVSLSEIRVTGNWLSMFSNLESLTMKNVKLFTCDDMGVDSTFDDDNSKTHADFCSDSPTSSSSSNRSFMKVDTSCIPSQAGEFVRYLPSTLKYLDVVGPWSIYSVSCLPKGIQKMSICDGFLSFMMGKKHSMEEEFDEERIHNREDTDKTYVRVSNRTIPCPSYSDNSSSSSSSPPPSPPFLNEDISPIGYEEDTYKNERSTYVSWPSTLNSLTLNLQSYRSDSNERKLSEAFLSLPTTLSTFRSSAHYSIPILSSLPSSITRLHLWKLPVSLKPDELKKIFPSLHYLTLTDETWFAMHRKDWTGCGFENV